MSFLICFKRSFIWAQSRCSSSRRLEMTCVWRWYAIFENGENEVHWFHLEPKRIRTHSNIFWHCSWTKRATLVRLVLNESSFKYLWDNMMFQMLLINSIMIDLNEKFVLSGSVHQSWEWKKSRRNSSDMIPRMSWISYMDQYRSLLRQWLLQMEVTPSTRDRNLMILAPDGEQMNFIVGWTKTFALGGSI